MTHEITERDLHNKSGSIMRGLEKGQSFIILRDGIYVGTLRPVGDATFADRESVLNTFAGASPIDAERFRSDVDRCIDCDVTPRA